MWRSPRRARADLQEGSLDVAVDRGGRERPRELGVGDRQRLLRRRRRGFSRAAEAVSGAKDGKVSRICSGAIETAWC
jgi:hypothetical protein